jgi:hypothetical protein
MYYVDFATRAPPANPAGLVVVVAAAATRTGKRGSEVTARSC